MEKVAIAGARSGRAAWGRCLAVATACSCAAWPVVAQEAAPAQEVVLAQARIDRSVQFEVNAGSVPRLDGQDAAAQGSRIDLAMRRAGGNGNGLGVALGLQESAPRTAMLPAGYTAVRPSVGLTWRHTLQGQGRIDVTAWKRMASEEDAYTLVQMREPVYGARVEMRLSPVRKAGFSVDRGSIGMQLESGARISIKRKDGRPMVYYRTAF